MAARPFRTPRSHTRQSHHQIGLKGQLQRPAGAQVVNADGKYIVPGLIDAKSNTLRSMAKPISPGGSRRRFGAAAAETPASRNATPSIAA
jgi:hypothetical protein